MSPTSPLGDFIRRQRELQQVSMRHFAEMAGISNPYLSQIERGLREPSQKVVEAIADSFDMTADALYAQAGVSLDDDDESSPTVRAAIEQDPALSARQRRALLDVYEAFVAAGPKRHARKS